VDTTELISAEQSGLSLDSLVDDDDDVAIAAITAAELLVGVALADRKHRDGRTRFVESVLGNIYVEEYSLEVARAHALLLAYVRRTGTPRGAHDLIIAATSVAANRILVTANEDHFADLPGLKLRVG